MHRVKKVSISAVAAYLVPACLGTTCIWGQSSVHNRVRSPFQVVAEYCRLDFAGVGLRGSHPKWPQLRDLIAGDEEWPDDQVVVVSGYRVMGGEHGTDASSVKVRYHV